LTNIHRARPSVIMFAALALAAAAPAPAPIAALDLMAGATTPDLDWRWRAPPEAALEPALFARLVRDRDAARAEAAAAGARDRRAGMTRPHALGQTWTAPFADDRLIALLGETYAYTGGAHGNIGHRALLWDRRAGREARLADMFADWPAAARMVESAACDALRAEKARRFAPDPPPADWTCPKLDEAVLVPAGRQAPGTFLRALYSPYVAGSYAEGTYDVRFEWPDGARALARPEWRDTLFGPAP
jgi:hypothetical protein